jgi:NADPH:quinone reductase-like Zn-dependent oxidoreductase
MRYLLSALLGLAAMGPAYTQVMRAVVVTEGGGLKVDSVAKPEPQAGQVRIQVRATSVNPVDWKRAGQSPAGSIPGKDIAGVIDEVGPQAGDWKKGQAVIALAPTGGAYAEYAIASAQAVALKPRQLSFAQAAGIPIVGETAWRALVTVADVQPGQKVLIHGGAGGVGSLAVQIAKARGAYVITTASAKHADLVRSLGAQEVIDYHRVRFEDQVHDVDMVLNTVDPDTAIRSIKVVRPGGILVSITGSPPEDQACQAVKIRCSGAGSLTGEMLGPLSEFFEKNHLHVPIDKELPFEQAAQAWSLSREGHTGGKIILDVAH